MPFQLSWPAKQARLPSRRTHSTAVLAALAADTLTEAWPHLRPHSLQNCCVVTAPGVPHVVKLGARSPAAARLVWRALGPLRSSSAYRQAPCQDPSRQGAMAAKSLSGAQGSLRGSRRRSAVPSSSARSSREYVGTNQRTRLRAVQHPGQTTLYTIQCIVGNAATNDSQERLP